MGLLADGDPLSWNEVKPLVGKLKKLGIDQFIRIYDQAKNRQGDPFKWGDEIEYILVKFDDQNEKVRLCLKAGELLKELTANEDPDPTKNESIWRPEFAEFMIEGMPGTPYGTELSSVIDMEQNMRNRRMLIHQLLDPGEKLMTMPCFPRVGCPGFTWPRVEADPTSDCSHSILYPDKAISDFVPRFRLSAKAVRHRRGSNVAINMPIYKDEFTPSPFREPSVECNDKYGEAIDDHVFMDATGCGCGCCALQVTIQAANLDEARYLYDQLTPITPIMLALSAGTPICRGFLVDVDSRWNLVSQASDDRTEVERGNIEQSDQNGGNGHQIEKGRHCTTDCYLHPDSVAYNNVIVQYEKEHFDRLMDAGIDSLLSQHIANLFIRDPLQVFRENLTEIENETGCDNDDCEYFEDIQSSNWKNIRFKPPPPNAPSIGWRVEFRPMDVQLTDFENAAYAMFIVLLTRAIISYRLSFLIPISKVDENMQRAQKRDAVLNEKFFFRHCDFQNASPTSKKVMKLSEHDPVLTNEYVEMTIDEIINGKPDQFPGLLPLVYKYLDSIDLDFKTRNKINRYLELISERANGRSWTLAHYIREFVRRHPEYKKDSVVNEKVCYDLLKVMSDIVDGQNEVNGKNNLHV